MKQERLNSRGELLVEGVLFGRTREVVRRQGARDRTSGGEKRYIYSGGGSIPKSA